MSRCPRREGQPDFLISLPARFPVIRERPQQQRTDPGRENNDQPQSDRESYTP
jgi:hypothetical protein